MHLVKNFLTHRTSRDVIVNTGGNYLGVLFAFLYTLLLARFLSVSDFGVLSVLLSFSYVLANIMDFGVTAATYAYLPNLVADKPRALQFLKTNLLFLTTLAVITLLALFAGIDMLDRQFLKLGVDRSYYFWTLLSVLFFLWQNFVLNILYSTKKFLSANVAANLSHVAKIIVLVTLYSTNLLSIPTIIIALGVVGPIIFILIITLQVQTHIVSFFSSQVQRQHIKFSYSLQSFMASQFFNLASRADLFMISYFLTMESVGHYALAQRIVLAIITSVNSITQVLSPQFAAAESREEVHRLLRRGAVYMLLPTALFVGVLVTPDMVYSLFFTKKFVSAAPVTRALSVAYMVYGFSVLPLLYFLYTLKKPAYVLAANGLFLVLVIVGCYTLIPQFGLMGGPITFGGAFIVVALFAFGAFIQNEKRR